MTYLYKRLDSLDSRVIKLEINVCVQSAEQGGKINKINQTLNAALSNF